ncbi:hypothetical protein B0T26DRAFT_681063 [Lasiosphaeria miniovina]|uniref:Uncharacterized protein n=1 Tax=Lasiosphaeria miniovina TaxID=1954250 RepID=A0AA39ZTF4_9PEZI|nr:uncharacterized protein B0T26DRAFT_681063 [Lasiosphaeria miniovina]KAK0703381.1 hypothetical protein B0T26DRAFT_681063 [Lasiosphaeria miniovina]
MSFITTFDPDYHAGLNVQLSCFDQLTHDQTRRCDDLIVKLGRLNMTRDVPGDATRKGLWDRVFWGWNTDMKIPPPYPKQRDRVCEFSQVGIGYLAVDLPGRQGVGFSTSTFLIDVSSLFFLVLPEGLYYSLDKNGTDVPQACVVVSSTSTLEQDQTFVSARWNSQEADRVRPWTIGLAVVWARHRLVDSVEAGECRAGTPASTYQGDKSQLHARIPENHECLVQLRQISTPLNGLAASSQPIVQSYSLRRTI